MLEYNHSDLLWTKNVTREKGQNWAYMEYNIGDVFDLNFSRGRFDMGITNARTPLRNQLILLVQTIKKASVFKPGTYLTHIVSTINDGNDVKIDPNGSHPVKRLVTVIAKNNNPIEKPLILDFREPNRGWICNINLIKPFPRTGLIMDLNEKQAMFWEMFTIKDMYIKQVISEMQNNSIEQTIEATEGKEGYWEGRHRFYERDRKIIKLKKDEAIKNGNLYCEICDLDFSKRYGELGRGFMECHHLYPIAQSGIRTNFLEDLALVCSNCHRMLHRKNQENRYLSINELRGILKISGL